MPRNKVGGNKAKKSANKNTNDRSGGRELKIKDKEDDGLLYGRVKNRLGGNPPYLEVECEDNKTRRCVVRGKMTKRVWMNVGDFVLITYDKESNRDEGEIEHKYDQTEANKLIKIGEIKSNVFNVSVTEDDDNIVFSNMVEEDVEYDENNNQEDIFGGLSESDSDLNIDDL